MAAESTGLMEPMLPALGNKELEDLAMELAKKSCALAGTMHPAVKIFSQRRDMATHSNFTLPEGASYDFDAFACIRVFNPQ